MRTWILSADHPGAADVCPGCGVPIGNEKTCTLVTQEPADDENRERKAAGRPYTTHGVLVHVECCQSAAKLAGIEGVSFEDP